jgi:hypothetical protein
VANEESADTIEDSGRWKAGLRLGIIEGVRTKTEGLAGFWGWPGCGLVRKRQHLEKREKGL